MIQNILLSIHTEFGKYIVSVILGLGLSSIFRKSCENRNCIVFKAPSFSEVKQNVYKHNDKCYTFTEKSVSCTGKNRKRVQFA